MTLALTMPQLYYHLGRFVFWMAVFALFFGCFVVFNSSGLERHSRSRFGWRSRRSRYDLERELNQAENRVGQLTEEIEERERVA
jgi:hypothetical protein